jgi:hypothetical protein
LKIAHLIGKMEFIDEELLKEREMTEYLMNLGEETIKKPNDHYGDPSSKQIEQDPKMKSKKGKEEEN